MNTSAAQFMPKKVRVDPAGSLVAVSARGTLMGNRGCLHSDAGAIVRNSARKTWICCLLQFKGRKRTRLTPGHYTELFFLDEATALAAGHRPCKTCRPDDLRSFSGAWGSANSANSSASAPEIDSRLAAERADNARTMRSSSQGLPDGTIVGHPLIGKFYPLFGGQLLPWSFAGYGAPVAAPTMEEPIKVMTPASVVDALRAGYRPRIHPSVS